MTSSAALVIASPAEAGQRGRRGKHAGSDGDRGLGDHPRDAGILKRQAAVAQHLCPHGGGGYRARARISL